MKRIVVLSFSLIAISLILSGQEKGPQISFTSSLHNFGVIAEEAGVVKHSFEFTNIGSVPLIVNRVATTCGCTASEWTKEPLLPGAKGTISIAYDPKGRPGPFNQSITVFSNASASGHVLSIRGQVTPRAKTKEEIYRRRLDDLGLSNSHLSLGSIFVDQIRTDTLFTYNFGDKPISLSFEMVPRFIKVVGKPETLKPKEEGYVVVTFDANQANDWGFVVNRIRLKVNNENPQGNLISISANIEEDFSVLTEKDLANAPQIEFTQVNKDFGTVKEGDVIEHVFIFTNTGKSDLIIRKIRSSCGCTTAAPKVSVIKPGEQSSLSASFRTSGFTGRQSKTVTVITNDPKRSTVVLRLSGTVTKQ